jgi:hypothetical protein
LDESVLDASDTPYVTGCMRSTDYPVTPGGLSGDLPRGNRAALRGRSGPTDAFVTKVAFSG